MNKRTILSVQHLSKSYPSGAESVAVLHDVSFSIDEGTTCAIVGPSGSGKTTLIALCAGLDRPTNGRVTLNGIHLNDLAEDELANVRCRYIGFVFQSFQLLPTLTALENVMVPAELRMESHARSYAVELLAKVGLEGRLHHYPVQLSGGEQQRVAIARAFMNRPKILFADEPTGNLDAQTSDNIIKHLFEMNEVLGTTLLLVTHDLDLTRNVQRIIRLKGGTIASDTDNAEPTAKSDAKVFI
ncbi:MAG: ABC transporter ATP-binding protein [Candidatus Binatia bacterium]